MALNPTISSSFVAVMDLMSSTASDIHYVNDSATTASNYTTSERLLPEALLDGLRELGLCHLLPRNMLVETKHSIFANLLRQIELESDKSEGAHLIERKKPCFLSAPVKLYKLTQTFSNQFSTLLRDEPETNNGVLQDILSGHESFKKAVLEHYPRFTPFTKAESASHTQGAKLERGWTTPQWESNEEESESIIPMDADDIIELLQRTRGRTLQVPGMHSRKAVELLTKRCNNTLGRLTFTFYHDIWTSLETFINQNVDMLFNGNEGLADIVREEAQKMLVARREMTTDRLEWLLSLEDGEPFTLNNELLLEYRSRMLSLFYKQRGQTDMSSSLSLVRNDRRGLHGEQMGMTPEGHSEVKVSGMSEVDSALDVMATVGAYFQISSGRYLDIIPLAVDHDLIKGLSHDIHKGLYDALMGKIDPDKIDDLLLGEGNGEDIELKRRHEKLQRVQRILLDLLEEGQDSDAMQSENETESGYASCSTS